MMLAAEQIVVANDEKNTYPYNKNPSNVLFYIFQYHVNRN